MIFFAYKWSRDDSFLIARWPKKFKRIFSRFLEAWQVGNGIFQPQNASCCRWCSHHIETEVLWPFYNKGVKKEVYNSSCASRTLAALAGLAAWLLRFNCLHLLKRKTKMALTTSYNNPTTYKVSNILKYSYYHSTNGT